MTYLFISKLRQLDTVAMIVGLQLGHVPLEHEDVTHRDSVLSTNLQKYLCLQPALGC